MSSPIFICETDYRKLSDLVVSKDMVVSSALEKELLRAEIVPDRNLPDNVVTMHSEVTFVDQDGGQKATVTVVYPGEADLDDLKISVLSPVGSALIGLSVDGDIEWPMRNGKVRRLKVVAVAQPAD